MRDVPGGANEPEPGEAVRRAEAASMGLPLRSGDALDLKSVRNLWQERACGAGASRQGVRPGGGGPRALCQKLPAPLCSGWLEEQAWVGGANGMPTPSKPTPSPPPGRKSLPSKSFTLGSAAEKGAEGGESLRGF